MSSFTLSLFSAAVLAASLLGTASAHGTITSVSGANGVQAAGFGIDPNTPRNGGLPIPFEQDTSVIRDKDIASGKTGVCGKTAKGGNNDVASQLAAASSAGLPTTSASGQLTMNLHQVNQDGAGPYTCDVSTDGGNTFQPAQVTTNVPGVKGLSLGVAQDFPLVMQASPGTTCAGGPNGNACIARCRNPALAGPFGSCVAFTMGGASSNASAAGAASNAATGAAAGAESAAGAASTAAAGAEGAAATGAAASGTAAAGTAGTAGAASGATGAIGAAAAGEAGGAGGAAAKGGKIGGALSKLFGGKRQVVSPSPKKRVIMSRVAGTNAGYWIDA